MTRDNQMLQQTNHTEPTRQARPLGADDPLLTNRQAAAILTKMGLPISEKSLPSMRCRGGDVPRFHRFGRRVLYRKSDLLGWVQIRLGDGYRSNAELAGRTA